MSENLRRRHLSASQLATVAVEALPLLEAEAAERRSATLKQNAVPDKEQIPYRDAGQARDKAAQLLGTNGRYVQDAKSLKQTAPEKFEQVRAG
jgi:hypothetical protein